MWPAQAEAVFSTFKEVEMVKVISEFVSPSLSPVFKAAAKGHSMLTDRSQWVAAEAFHT